MQDLIATGISVSSFTRLHYLTPVNVRDPFVLDTMYGNMDIRILSCVPSIPGSGGISSEKSFSFDSLAYVEVETIDIASCTSIWA